VNRRQFLKTTAGGAAFLAFAQRAYPYAFSTPLKKFIQPLPALGTNIPVAAPNKTKYPGTDYYRIIMGQYTAKVHPDLPKATTFWGYADATANAPVFKPLGGVIVATRRRPVRITYENYLPALSIIPIDPTIQGAETGQFQNRTVPHLHGGLVPWTSDGGPFAWFTPSPSAANSKTHGPDWQPGDYWYPNDQSARLLWYHDHAFGQTRTNAYANIASAYVITDDEEQRLIANGTLPGIGIPLVFQDKTFVPPNVLTKDPTWKWGKPGDLWYPHVYEPSWYEVASPALPMPPVSCVPEAFFDHMMVNCAVFPFLEVKRGRYRFRMLNACNARFLNLQLYKAQTTTLSDPLSGEPDLASSGPAFIQIGTEGGFLPAPVVLNNPPVQLGFDGGTGNANAYTLLMAPAERADVIIDFSDCATGDVLILYSDTTAPFPGGDPRNVFYTGDPDQTGDGGAPTTLPGYGPNSATIMQFRVVSGTPPDTMDAEQTLERLEGDNPLYNLATAYANSQPGPLNLSGLEPQGKTLTEDFDIYGRLVQRLGTTQQNGVNNQGLPTWGRDFTMVPVTETASNGETQVWDIYNLTGDTHPIHFHLVNVQILGRAPFDFATPVFTPAGGFVPPDANERGWKETVRMNPGEVTRVAMKFDAPAPPSWVKFRTSPRTGGNEYVWHCHILEHEEHDMMRNLVVF
jgi:spore coat protein A, manganese oxidase